MKDNDYTKARAEAILEHAQQADAAKMIINTGNPFRVIQELWEALNVAFTMISELAFHLAAVSTVVQSLTEEVEELKRDQTVG